MYFIPEIRRTLEVAASNKFFLLLLSLLVHSLFLAYRYFNMTIPGLGAAEALFFGASILPVVIAAMLGVQYVLLFTPIYAVTAGIPGYSTFIFDNVCDIVFTGVLISTVLSKNFWKFARRNRVLTTLVCLNFFSVWLSFFFGQPAGAYNHQMRQFGTLSLGLSLLTFLAIIYHLQREHPSVQRIYGAFAASGSSLLLVALPGMVMVLLCLGDYEGAKNVFVQRLIPYSVMPGGSAFGLIVALLCIFGLRRIDTRPNRPWLETSLIFGGLALAAIGIGLTASTAAFVSFALIVLIWIVLPPYRRRWGSKIGVLVILCTIPVFQQYAACACADEFPFLVQADGQVNADGPPVQADRQVDAAGVGDSPAHRFILAISGDTHRATLLSRTLADVLNIGLGTGVGGESFYVVNMDGETGPGRTQNIVRAHNVFLTTFIERGIFGLLTTSALLIWILWPVFRIRAWADTSDVRRCWLMAFAAIAVSSLAQDIDMSEWFWIIIAAAVVTLRPELRHGTRRALQTPLNRTLGLDEPASQQTNAA